MGTHNSKKHLNFREGKGPSIRQLFTERKINFRKFPSLQRHIKKKTSFGSAHVREGGRNSVFRRGIKNVLWPSCTALRKALIR
jgi:hypothetical protein